MKQVVVSTYSYEQQAKDYLEKRLASLDLKEYRPNMMIEKKQGTTFITCYFSETISILKQKYNFKEYIIMPMAQAMVDVIENEFSVIYGNEIIEKLDQGEGIEILGIEQNETQRNKLLGPIVDQMIKEDSFCLDGWIKFRLCDYKRYIKKTIENLVFEYQVYQEYEEFIVLLKEYILRQKNGVPVIHIIPDDNGQMNLYNERYEIITRICEEEHDDLILGALLSLSPVEIIIHKLGTYSNRKLIDTIKMIYDEKITICSSCKYCNQFALNRRIMRVLKDILTQKKL